VPPNVRLRLASKPENVLIVRQALAGVAEAIDLHSGDLDDIKTAVTEACNNVVLHAYRGEQGPLEVDVYIPASGIEVVVRDHGIGLCMPVRSSRQTALGLGLPVIEALTRGLEFAAVKGGGTELRMRFAATAKRMLESPRQGESQPSIFADAELATTTALLIAPAILTRSVLPRILSVLAARAHFSTDRICDAQLVADTLAANVSESSHLKQIALAVSVQPRDLTLHLGPMDGPAARALIGDCALVGVGPIIEKLADHQVASAGSSDVHALRLLD
jgi:anti-sigma regulatory factor (Ser/Thr protein kinase)